MLVWDDRVEKKKNPTVVPDSLLPLKYICSAEILVQILIRASFEQGLFATMRHVSVDTENLFAVENRSAGYDLFKKIK